MFAEMHCFVKRKISIAIPVECSTFAVFTFTVPFPNLRFDL